MTDSSNIAYTEDIKAVRENLNEIINILGIKKLYKFRSKYKLNAFGNSCSIVFHNKKTDDSTSNKNILFTGDVTKGAWRYIEKKVIEEELKLHETYCVIKVPHHGTKGKHHDFKVYINEETNVLISNGHFVRARYEIYEEYASDVMAKNGKIYCSSNDNCNSCSSSKCRCTNRELIGCKKELLCEITL